MINIIKDGEGRYKNLVNGEWISSEKGDYIRIKSPIDGTEVGSVPAMTKEKVDLAIETAREAQKKWKSTTIDERSEILNKTADILLKQKEELAELMIREIAKDRKGCISEVERTSDFIRFSADVGKNLSGESIRGDSYPGGKRNKVSIVQREPLGVVLAISPL